MTPGLRRVRRVAAAVIGTAAVAGAGCERAQPRLAAEKPAVVVVGRPVTDYVSDYEDFTGHTEAVFSVNITARVSGYLDKVHFKDGDEVNQGDLLFEIDPRPYKAEYDRTESTLAQSQAHLKRLDADYRRVSKLFSSGAAGREELDLVTGNRAEAESAVGVAQAAFDLAKLSLEFTKVKAPIAGRLSRRMVDPGNLVTADTTMLTSIKSLDPLYVYFDVDERTLLRLRRLVAEKKIPSRAEAEIPVLVGLSDEAAFPHKGLINFSDNTVDQGTGTLRVRASIANPKPRVLSPGMFTRVRLPVGAPRRSVLVAEKAIGTDQGQKYLYVVNDKNVVMRKNIKVGKLDGGLREIEDGLAAGQRVVVEGLQRVRPGAKVDPVDEETANQRDKLAPAPAARPKSVASHDGRG
jgi:RND family efflux transporter MFP subunit